MDPNGMIGLMNLITLGGGIYSLYAWFQMRGGTIPPNFALQNRDLPREKCLDEEYYVSYMRPRLLVLALILIAFGAFNLLDAQFGLLQAWIPESAYLLVSFVVGSLIPLAVIVWFAVCLSKIQKELW